MQIAAVILAAGASTRFGSPKHLVRIGGRTMLEMVAASARDAGLAPILAVVSPGLAVPQNVVPVVNEAPEVGISRSLQLGVGAVPPEAAAAVILLGDEPFISAENIREVLFAADESPIVATRAGERIGPPVLLRREAFQVVTSATGDHGLGQLLRSRPDIATVELPASPVDVDTPDDLDAVAMPWVRGDR